MLARGQDAVVDKGDPDRLIDRQVLAAAFGGKIVRRLVEEGEGEAQVERVDHAVTVQVAGTVNCGRRARTPVIEHLLQRRDAGR